jgi:hypothetical protein
VPALSEVEGNLLLRYWREADSAPIKLARNDKEWGAKLQHYLIA